MKQRQCYAGTNKTFILPLFLRLNRNLAHFLQTRLYKRDCETSEWGLISEDISRELLFKMKRQIQAIALLFIGIIGKQKRLEW